MQRLDEGLGLLEGFDLHDFRLTRIGADQPASCVRPYLPMMISAPWSDARIAGCALFEFHACYQPAFSDFLQVFRAVRQSIVHDRQGINIAIRFAATSASARLRLIPPSPAKLLLMGTGSLFFCPRDYSVCRFSVEHKLGQIKIQLVSKYCHAGSDSGIQAQERESLGIPGRWIRVPTGMTILGFGDNLHSGPPSLQRGWRRPAEPCRYRPGPNARGGDCR